MDLVRLSFSSFLHVVPTICYHVSDMNTFNNAQDDMDSIDGIILAGKSIGESEKNCTTNEVVSNSNPRKMPDIDTNELPPMEEEE